MLLRLSIDLLWCREDHLQTSQRIANMISAVVIVILIVATAFSGAIFKPGEWYQSLQKPSWTPPNWAFPTVWTILYAMIGYSGWLVWTIAGPSLVFALWLLQLLFNAGWSYLFFGRKRMDQAFADVMALFATIVAYIFLTWSITPLGALLFVPYAVWVVIAAKLNHTVWKMNPGRNHAKS